MTSEHGPFDSERQAMSTRAAARLRAVFDAATDKVGCTDAEALAVLVEACEESGVSLGDLDRGVLRWLARWENSTVIAIAGMIRRAHESGAKKDEKHG